MRESVAAIEIIETALLNTICSGCLDTYATTNVLVTATKNYLMNIDKIPIDVSPEVNVTVDVIGALYTAIDLAVNNFAFSV